MNPPGDRATPRVVILCTSFPVLSETFLQREISVFRTKELPFDLVSLWGGVSRWQGMRVERNALPEALLSVLFIPFWLFYRPAAIWELTTLLWRPRASGLLNWIENLLGAAYGLRTASRWKAGGITHFHAVWASAPAMAALTLHKLTDIPFSFGGHAYDLYEKGGDGWLSEKIPAASFVRTSTEAGKSRFIEKGADESKVLLARRGLLKMPPVRTGNPPEEPFRFISVGRMVEKMGFDRQIPVMAALKKRGLRFSMSWIGDGPERAQLEKQVRDADLQDHIRFFGRLPYEEVEKAYAESDIFLFTGRVDRNGDRAGLPNAVAEAMAWGLTVFATDVGGTTEAVHDRETGFLWPGEPEVDMVIDVLHDAELQGFCRRHARKWIEDCFDLNQNLGPLIARLEHVTLSNPDG